MNLIKSLSILHGTMEGQLLVLHAHVEAACISGSAHSPTLAALGRPV
jgi:hypothetical protein